METKTRAFMGNFDYRMADRKAARGVQFLTQMTLSQPLRRGIGVFDSGVGGLTVLQALRRQMPQSDFVYLGDTARVPYGRKPPEMVVDFATGIAEFLCGMGIEGLVVACNTASAVALPTLTERCPVPVWGVIDPGVEAAARVARSGRVGVIGTKGTIASGAYQRRIEARGMHAWARPAPCWCTWSRKGWPNRPRRNCWFATISRDGPISTR